MFFVRSGEKHACPCCGGPLKVIGSRQRKVIQSSGEYLILVVRRLRCEDCRRIHHELPDLVVPYKRYDRESIEKTLETEGPQTVACDESTVFRWRVWFKGIRDYLVGCLLAIRAQFSRNVVKDFPLPSPSSLQRLQELVGDAPGWLARVVRPIVNTNYWIHTRLAFLS